MKGDNMKKIYKEKFGFSTGQSFGEHLDVLMDNGINYLEFRIAKGNDRELIQGYIDLILKRKAELGFETYTVHLPQLPDYDLSNTNEEQRLEAIKKQKEIALMAMPLEYSVLVLHPDSGKVPEEDYEKRHEALIKSLKDFAPWCKEHGLKLAIENLTQLSSVQTSSALVKIIEAVGSDNLGICFDTNHLFKETHREFIKNAGKYIITMHVTDNDGETEKHWFPGDGVINWKEIFELLDEIGYDSTMICESAHVFAHDDYPQRIKELGEKWLELHN